MGSDPEGESRWTKITDKGSLGCKEGEKAQSDSPTLSRESLKMYFAVEANEGFKLRSIDIREAFL